MARPTDQDVIDALSREGEVGLPEDSLAMNLRCSVVELQPVLETLERGGRVRMRGVLGSEDPGVTQPRVWVLVWAAAD